MSNAWYPTQVAASTPFDNSTNGFTADETQAAIEEARISAIGSLINPHFNATGNNVFNKWLGHNNPAAPSNDVPWVIPQDTQIKGVTFSNADANSDTDIEIYVNGTLEETIEIRGYEHYYTAGTLSVSMSQGDRVSIFIRQYGLVANAPSNPNVGLYCKIVLEQGGTGGA